MPRYSEINAGQAENQPGHKPFENYELPRWCSHPLKLQEGHRAALIFPGEHTSFPGMLPACRELPIVQEMLELATQAFEFDVERAMREGSPEDSCHRTDRSQMLAFVAGCAAFELLKDQRPEVALKPHVVAGFSVGEFAALVAAGVFDYDQGLIIVKARAEAMDRWASEVPMSAVGIYGLPEEQVLRLCDEAVRRQKADSSCQDPEVYISHIWGHLCNTCSGNASTVQLLHQLIGREGGNEVFSQIIEHHEDASHTPMAAEVAKEVEIAIRSIPLNPPRCEVLFNHGYRVVPGDDPETFLSHIVDQLTSPVRWSSIVSTAIQRGVQRFYECGPGESLKELMVFNHCSDAQGDGVVNPHVLTVNLEL